MRPRLREYASAFVDCLRHGAAGIVRISRMREPGAAGRRDVHRAAPDFRAPGQTTGESDCCAGSRADALEAAEVAFLPGVSRSEGRTAPAQEASANPGSPWRDVLGNNCRRKRFLPGRENMGAASPRAVIIWCAS
jgi:hypothetical protein